MGLSGSVQRQTGKPWPLCDQILQSIYRCARLFPKESTSIQATIAQSRPARTPCYVNLVVECFEGRLACQGRVARPPRPLQRIDDQLCRSRPQRSPGRRTRAQLGLLVLNSERTQGQWIGCSSVGTVLHTTQLSHRTGTAGRHHGRGDAELPGDFRSRESAEVHELHDLTLL